MPKLISIYPEEKLMKKIKNTARSEGRSVNQFLILVISRYLNGGFESHKEIEEEEDNEDEKVIPNETINSN